MAPHSGPDPVGSPPRAVLSHPDGILGRHNGAHATKLLANMGADVIKI